MPFCGYPLSFASAQTDSSLGGRNWLPSVGDDQSERRIGCDAQAVAVGSILEFGHPVRPEVERHRPLTVGDLRGLFQVERQRRSPDGVGHRKRAGRWEPLGHQGGRCGSNDTRKETSQEHLVMVSQTQRSRNQNQASRLPHAWGNLRSSDFDLNIPWALKTREFLERSGLTRRTPVTVTITGSGSGTSWD